MALHVSRARVDSLDVVHVRKRLFVGRRCESADGAMFTAPSNSLPTPTNRIKQPIYRRSKKTISMAYKQISNNSRISTRRDKDIETSQQTKLQKATLHMHAPSIARCTHACTKPASALSSRRQVRSALSAVSTFSLQGERAPWPRLPGKASTELELA